ncbi:oxidoreductase [Helicobacter monodelphidis]|uniref:4Fe-4S dicluster domain-containing protein n=1 Tax=Helicobacter sp. 15-1451 TaxID=2004995 RepID=UPI000DCDC996|nr:4Fe-4S dicluster domain-containing protein [Helicobacter sp. 15-1451]RAX57096.1 oxidoreductase [Helicobacter sp. 15-1451]
MQRRNFFKFVAATSMLGAIGHASTNPHSSLALSPKKEGFASIINLDLCDGCQDFDMPKCVSACRDKNQDRFPKPIENIPDYFPRKIKEDYSNNQDDITRLTPYNWTFVENVSVDNQQIFIPRRCMHCDDPTCQKICPFGVIDKDKTNAVNIDEHFCFGGAKCRDVCPWGIPQRQAGVGIYLKIAPKLAGGGAMFKCDMCADLIQKGQHPACQRECPKNAIIFDKKGEILKVVNKMKESGKFVYGDTQNGGTSTFYVSSVSFEKINQAIAKKYGETEESFNQKTQKMGRPHMNIEVENFINNDSTLVKSVLSAPVLGVIAGAIAVSRSNKKTKNKG